MDQMMGKAVTAMEQCGLFPTALLEFNAFLDEHKDWANTKSHFGEAYENLITTGAGIRVPGTIANIQELEDDNDSLGTITDVMSTMQMANNANAQQVRGDVSVLRQELAAMRAMLQQANNSRLQVQAPMPVLQAPPQYAAPPAPLFAQYAPPPAPAPSYYSPPPMAAYASVPT